MIARLALAIALLGGVWIRFGHLETKSLSHPEMWAPLLPLPWELADPGVRSTLYEAVVHNLMADTHPPGYTIAVWAWMRIAGTSVLALRLPSLVCGSASIWLLYAIGRRSGSNAPWLAPLLFAFNGYAVLWSAVARMYAPATFTVLLAVWLLMRLGERWRDWLAALYATVLVACCSLHVFGWIFAGTHLLWSARDRRAAWWQLLAMIVASPLLAFAAYQSFHPVAELARNPLPVLTALAGFGIALPSPEIVDVFDPAGQPPPWNGAMSAGITVLGLALAWVGWPAARSGEEKEGRPPSAIWLLAAAGLACAIILLFVSRIAHPHQGIRLARMASAIPWLLAASWAIVPRLPRWPGVQPSIFILTAAAGLLSVATLAIPMATLRGVQLFAPLVLLPISDGIVRIVFRRPWTAPVFCVLMPVLCWASVRGLASRQLDPVDLKSFAQAVQPHLQPDDLILWRRSWDTTPMLYYLSPRRYRYSTAICDERERTLWEFRLYGQPLPEPLRACVAGKTPEVIFQRGPALAIRYRPPVPPAASTPLRR